MSRKKNNTVSLPIVKPIISKQALKEYINICLEEIVKEDSLCGRYHSKDPRGMSVSNEYIDILHKNLIYMMNMVFDISIELSIVRSKATPDDNTLIWKWEDTNNTFFHIKTLSSRRFD